MTERMVHFIADETLGGIERQYIEEPGRKASVGDYVVSSEQLGHVDRIYEVYHVAIGCVLGKYSRGSTSLSYYRKLSPTNIVRIGGKRYELADRKAEVGEEVIVTTLSKSRLRSDDYEIGDVLTVTDTQEDVPGFNEGIETDDYFLFTEEYNVLIPIEESEAPEGAPKDTHDLIASLSAEVARLSRKLAEVTEQADSNAKDIRTWADDYTETKLTVDTVESNLDDIAVRQRNINVKVSGINDKLEMLTDDICTLNERTQSEDDDKSFEASSIKTFAMSDLNGKSVKIHSASDMCDGIITTTTIAVDDTGKTYLLAVERGEFR